MKYQPGTKWNRIPTPAQEAQEFHDYVQELRKKMKDDPEIGKRLMQRAGIIDENGELAEKYRDPEES